MALEKARTKGTGKDGGKSRWAGRQLVKDAAKKHRRREDKNRTREEPHGRR